jgi:hypothetical protein
MAVQPALERRWEDTLAAFDARIGIGVLGVRGRADTVEELSELLQSRGVKPLRRSRPYGPLLHACPQGIRSDTLSSYERAGSGC